MIYLCDTCVLIDYLRGKTKVQQKLEQDKGLGLGMSSITYFDGSRAISGERRAVRIGRTDTVCSTARIRVRDRSGNCRRRLERIARPAVGGEPPKKKR